MFDIVVVLISFNRRKLLQQTIESIQKNSVMNVKIIVVDNSKDEETPKYLESLKDIIYYRFPKLDEAYDEADHVLADTIPLAEYPSSIVIPLVKSLSPVFAV